MMKDMKCSMSKLFRSFFIFVLILIIVFPATGFAAKTKKSSSANLKSNKNVQNTDMTKKYKKQMNNILEATQLFYSVRLNYSMKSGESKKDKAYFSRKAEYCSRKTDFRRTEPYYKFCIFTESAGTFWCKCENCFAAF